jgi:hypothetical protein
MDRVASPLQLRQSTWRDLEFGATIGSANPGFDGFQAGPELASAGGKGLGYEYGLIRCMEVDGARVATDFSIPVRLPCESMPWGFLSSTMFRRVAPRRKTLIETG